VTTPLPLLLVLVEQDWFTLQHLHALVFVDFTHEQQHSKVPDAEHVAFGALQLHDPAIAIPVVQTAAATIARNKRKENRPLHTPDVRNTIQSFRSKDNGNGCTRIKVQAPQNT
jgi:hypothetical protein